MASAGSTVDRRVTIGRMTGTFGAEIVGVDMADGCLETAEFLRKAAIANRVIVVRDQKLGIEDQLAFADRLGTVIYTRSLAHNSDHPEILVVKNPAKGGQPTYNWHTDATTSERPPSLTVLAAQVLPPAGGDTLFVDMVQAYNRLTPSYRRMLRGLKLRHINRLYTPDNPPEQWHPIVRTIPETGERALFPGFPSIAESIDDWSIAESKPVIDFLFNQSLDHGAIYRHRWLPGDVVIWDNRTTMHYAVHDYGDEDRFLNRVMIEGEAPYDAAYED